MHLKEKYQISQFYNFLFISRSINRCIDFLV